LTLGISNSWRLLDIYSWSWYHNGMQLADACQSVVEGAAWGFMNLPESMGLCVVLLVPAGTAYTQAQTEI
jgi:hypothetical protein